MGKGPVKRPVADCSGKFHFLFFYRKLVSAVEDDFRLAFV